MPQISIIVPVYKSEAYLDVLIKSIQDQDFQDWQLILVDDGSPDNSGVLCDEYASNDSRITVVHKNNGGISSACNAGIEASEGDWLIFCDHDDYLTPNSLSLLSEAAKEPNIDLIAASYIRYKENVLQEDRNPGERKTVSAKQYLEGTCTSPFIRYNEFYLWNKLLKASIIKAHVLRFREDIHYYQDVLFAYQYLFLCEQNVYCHNRPVYVYFKKVSGESSSITQQYNPKKSPGRLYSHIFIYESFKAAPSFFSKTTDRYLKNNILESYYWLNHSFRRSRKKDWRDLKNYTQAILPYYSRWQLLWCWVVRHARIRYQRLVWKLNIS